jgi:hypothetical protein
VTRALPQSGEGFEENRPGPGEDQLGEGVRWGRLAGPALASTVRSQPMGDELASREGSAVTLKHIGFLTVRLT